MNPKPIIHFKSENFFDPLWKGSDLMFPWWDEDLRNKYRWAKVCKNWWFSEISTFLHILMIPRSLEHCNLFSSEHLTSEFNLNLNFNHWKWWDSESHLSDFIILSMEFFCALKCEGSTNSPGGNQFDGLQPTSSSRRISGWDWLQTLPFQIRDLVVKDRFKIPSLISSHIRETGGLRNTRRMPQKIWWLIPDCGLGKLISGFISSWFSSAITSFLLSFFFRSFLIFFNVRVLDKLPTECRELQI